MRTLARLRILVLTAAAGMVVAMMVAAPALAAANALPKPHVPGRGLNIPAAVSPQAKRTWGKALEAPGIAALNTGGYTVPGSVSCASTGNCSAGGSYLTGSAQNITEPFVISETGGKWGQAIEVPGIAALNSGNNARVAQVSCASAGNCTAVGGYSAAVPSASAAFAVSETGGIWGQAIEIPGTAPGAAFAVSCASAGNCTAGGQSFVVSQTGGTWGQAIPVPGAAALGVGAEVSQVSCASAGNCSAGGTYVDANGATQVFVVSQTGGTWGQALAVPGYAALNSGDLYTLGGVPGLDSMSCTSPGNCSAGGSYIDGGLYDQSFVVSQTGGTWGQAIEVPGTQTLNHGSLAGGTAAVSCASAGNCSAGGTYTDASNATQAFVVSQTGGTWGQAIEVPGTAALNHGSIAGGTAAVSCASAGNCSAGGTYQDATGALQSFVVSQTGGTWGQAIEVPGLEALNVGRNARLTALSCAPAGTCSAEGAYVDANGATQIFVVSQTSCRSCPGTMIFDHPRQTIIPGGSGQPLTAGRQ